jgi:hypothetical protein
MTMILALTFILSGCGNKLTAKDVAGTYTCTKDVKKYINDGMKEGFAESSGMENVDFSFDQPINADFVLTLNEDETFDLKIDMETFAEAFNGAIDAEGETALGTVELVDATTPYTVLTYNEAAGAAVLTEYPGRCNVQITVSAKANYRPGSGYTVNGYRIAVGEMMSVRCADFTGNGSCISVMQRG